MKKSIPPFLAGVATTLLIGALSVSALAITGHMTLEVDPINIQVNGEVFQPKDAAGNDVPVFVYQGTTYAPLRALAEAYGLEVGYDKEKNLAYVIDPDVADSKANASDSQNNLFSRFDTDYSGWTAEQEAEYQEFKKLWTVEEREVRDGTDGHAKHEKPFGLHCNDKEFTTDAFWEMEGKGYVTRLAYELWNADEDKGSYDRLIVWFDGDGVYFLFLSI